jgi:hypothetical protein
MSSLTLDELRRGISALAIIDRHGRDDDLALILRKATAATQSAALWGNATAGQVIQGQSLARRLATLLGEPIERCEQAAADVFAPERHRAVLGALVAYADELTGTARREVRLVGEGAV